MASNASVESGRKATLRGLGMVAAILFVVLLYLFHESFLPGKVIHSNDGPLGAISSQAAQLPSGFKGQWQDLNWLGGEGVSAAPTVTAVSALLLKPLGFAKFFAPIAFFLLGVSAWAFCRQLKLAPMACIIAGIAAALNSDFFSTGCWGVVAQPVTFAANFLALAAATNGSSRHPWLRTILAGFCVGLGVMEGFDIGAIFSLFTAAYVLFQTWNTEEESPAGKKLGRGVVRVAVVALFAGFIAFQTVDTLVATQVKGVAGADQDKDTKQQQWGFATQWSLPKAETFQILVPGIFGYRMDSPNGGNYWGIVGQDPMVPELVKQLSDPDERVRKTAEHYLGQAGFRFSGSGIYAGVPVLIIAFWALFQSFRRQGSPFSRVQRRFIRFWAAIGLLGLLMAYGKYAPFYQFFYALPFASTIRNPFKFIHIFNLGLILLFAYGLDGIFRTYMQNPVSRVSGWWAQFKAWWAKAPAFDKKWFIGFTAVFGLSLLGGLIYASANPDLKAYLGTVGFDPVLAKKIAEHSLRAVGWFLVLLTLSFVLLGVILSGQFSGTRAKWGALLLGGLVLFDLAFANQPWIIYWDTGLKYVSNPIIDFLRERPYEHRVTMLPFGGSSQQFGLFGNVYGLEWKQHLFQYYNIQSPDVVQEPRMTVEKQRFLKALPLNSPANILRTWELTNTRYLLGEAGIVEALNQQIDPVARRFRVVQPFNLAPKPGTAGTSVTDYTAVPDPNGELAVIEFTGALPRASLYSNWQISTNDDATLKTLASPEFDPHKTVLVSDPIAAPSSSANTNQAAGAVQIKPNYEPKRVELEADVKTPSVLLLDDRFSPKWHVTVDGQEKPLLRCNYITRGVYLEPGHHDVVFQFSSPMKPLYISLAAVALGLALCLWLALDAAKSAAPARRGSAQPDPQAKPVKV